MEINKLRDIILLLIGMIGAPIFLTLFIAWTLFREVLSCLKTKILGQ